MAASQEGLGGLVGSKNLRVGVASGIIGGGAAVSPTTASELQQSGRSGSPPGMLGAGGAGVGSPAGGVGMGAGTPLPLDVSLGRVMSDVRPWGKRSTEVALSQNSTAAFLKRNSGARAGMPAVRQSFPVGP